MVTGLIMSFFAHSPKLSARPRRLKAPPPTLSLSLSHIHTLTHAQQAQSVRLLQSFDAAPLQSRGQPGKAHGAGAARASGT
jgi:hypothetical protein